MERFAEKKLKFIQFNNLKNDLSLKLQKQWKRTEARTELVFGKLNLLYFNWPFSFQQYRISKLAHNLTILERIINDKKAIIQELNLLLLNKRRDKLQSHHKQRDLKEKIGKLKLYTDRQRMNLSKSSFDVARINQQSQAVIREKVTFLTTFIYLFNEEHVDVSRESVMKSSQNYRSPRKQSAPLLSFAQEDDEDDDEEENIGFLNHKSLTNKARKVGLSSSNFVFAERHSNKTNLLEETTIPPQVVIKFKICEPWITVDENYNAFCKKRDSSVKFQN